MFQPDTIHIGFVHDTRVEAAFAVSLAEMAAITPQLKYITSSRSARQHVARNDVVQNFMERDAEWLLEIDSDMVFDRHAALQILAAAKKAKAKVVHAEAFGYHPESKTVHTGVWLWNEEKQIYDILDRWKWGSRFWVDAAGAAFLLLHRSILEAVGDPWHENVMEHPDTGLPMGHDIALHHKIRKATGERTLYCSDIQIGHVKSFIVTRETYIGWLEAQ